MVMLCDGICTCCTPGTRPSRCRVTSAGRSCHGHDVHKCRIRGARAPLLACQERSERPTSQAGVTTWYGSMAASQPLCGVWRASLLSFAGPCFARTPAAVPCLLQCTCYAPSSGLNSLCRYFQAAHAPAGVACVQCFNTRARTSLHHIGVHVASVGECKPSCSCSYRLPA